MASLEASFASAKPLIVRKNGEVLPPRVIQDLKSKIKSEVIVKGEASEAAYRAAIHRWNEAYISEASIIVFCESEEDVSTCLHYSGASSSHGFVIDLRKMRNVVFDKANMTVTAQGGCIAADIEKPADDEGFSTVFGAVNETGIGGITMGGGTGPLSGSYGTVADNLVAAKIVLADGSILQASEKENSDLFWAIRGCGPNFGVVTEFTYKLHKQEGPVFQGVVAFSPDKLDAFLALINPLYEVVDKCAGKFLFMVAFGMLPGSPGVNPLSIIFYDGPEAEARSLAAPLFELGPIMNQCSMKRYPEVTVATPMVTGPPTHQRYACKNVQIVPPLDIAAIKGFAEDFGAFRAKYGASVAPSKFVIDMRYTGVTSSVPVNAMAYAGRRPSCLFVAEAQYGDAALDKTLRSEMKMVIDNLSDRSAKAIGKAQEDVLVLNANIGTRDEKIQSMFGENLPRLKELKKKYDPECVFDKWYPIRLE